MGLGIWGLATRPLHHAPGTVRRLQVGNTGPRSAWSQLRQRLPQAGPSLGPSREVTGLG